MARTVVSKTALQCGCLRYSYLACPNINSTYLESEILFCRHHGTLASEFYECTGSSEPPFMDQLMSEEPYRRLVKPSNEEMLSRIVRATILGIIGLVLVITSPALAEWINKPPRLSLPAPRFLANSDEIQLSESVLNMIGYKK